MSAKKFFYAVTVLIFFVFPTMGYTQGYQLVWSDEFDGPDIDLTKWEHEVNGLGGGNNELQYYTDRLENSFIENGCLVIQALEETFTGPDGTREYTSARLRTLNKGDFLYGRFEARIKLPSGQGMWPAFWMLPTDWVYGGWAASGEIDVMEAINIPKSVYSTIHYGGAWPDNVSSGCTYTEGHGPKATDFSKDFHIYSMEWEPGIMRWYVDGNLFCTKTDWWSSAAPFPAPFNQRFYILLNLAVGGDWPGAPDASTVFPQHYIIDYVRVYQIANDPPSVTITNPQDGASLPVGDILIEATASDPDGSITSVAFYQNGNYLGEDTTEPYSYTWNGTTDGCYTLRAIAADDGGYSAEDEIDITVGIGCPQTPFYGTPMSVPGTIEAEDFDLGRAGEAYYDTDAGNAGGAYRTNVDVDIEACGEGGYNIGWINPDEWLEYTVNVSAAENYTIEVRAASLTSGGTFHIEFDGVDVTGPVSVPATGDWQAWTTVQISNVSLDAGEQVMRFYSESDGYNLNFIKIIEPGGVATSMHVSSIIEGTQRGGPGRVYGTATVTIVDNLGAPVTDATVSGTFSGDFNESVSGVTDGSGLVMLMTSIDARKPVFSFCVDDVTHNLLVYNSAANVITCSPLNKSIAGIGSNDFSVSNYRLYPNPFNSDISLLISCTKDSEQPATIDIVNILGSRVHHAEVTLQAGDNLIRWQPTMDIGTGLYIVKINAQGFRKDIKIMYLK
ncbi:glycosyl hydrolase family protein [candidate division KSB1 bacterium]|nr:family 16 glycosylhydrolase [candidate division KSB1 bacterium]RQW06343.1 MAG: glycosyl hydrolase family protein [candidate division KSB1 bacterium]